MKKAILIFLTCLIPITGFWLMFFFGHLVNFDFENRHEWWAFPFFITDLLMFIGSIVLAVVAWDAIEKRY